MQLPDKSSVMVGSILRLRETLDSSVRLHLAVARKREANIATQ